MIVGIDRFVVAVGWLIMVGMVCQRVSPDTAAYVYSVAVVLILHTILTIRSL